MQFKTLLEEWRSFQAGKQAAMNQFSCRLSMRRNDILIINPIDATLIVENTIKVHSNPRGLTYEIKLDELRGYNKEGRNMDLIIQNGDKITLTLQTPLLHAAAFSRVEQFARERVDIPSPPSSEEGSSDSN